MMTQSPVVKTPHAIAEIIEQLAEDKATKMRTLAKATVVIVTTPEWLRAEEANALLGLPLNQLNDKAKSGEIVAKKTDPYLTTSAVIFNTESIRKSIGKMMDYKDWVAQRPDLKPTKGDRK